MEDVEWELTRTKGHQPILVLGRLSSRWEARSFTLRYMEAKDVDLGVLEIS